MRSILLLQHSQSQYEVIPRMVEQLQQGLEQMGARVAISDCSSYEQLFSDVEKHNPDCTWSINIAVEEDLFYIPLGIPHVYLSVDAMTHCCPEFLKMNHLIPLFVDKTSSDLFVSKNHTPSHWFPHAISQTDLDTFRSRPIIPLNDRPYDIVLMGTCIDHHKEKKRWSSLFLPSIADDFEQMAERALEEPSFLLHVEVLNFIESTPSILAMLDAFGIGVWDLVNSVERYMRGLDRERLLRSFPGRTIHLFSNEQTIPDWVRALVGPTLLLHKEVPFSDAGDLCSQSRIVLNSMPMIRQGFHERLFLALASGATVVTTQTSALPSWLENAGALSYTTSSLATVSERLHRAKPHGQEKIFEWLEKNHTWKARLQAVLPKIDSDVQDLRTRWKENQQ